jgi:hypothetical protein
VIASQFNLEHRIAELRPSESELRVARERRDAAAQATRIARAAGQAARRWLGGTQVAGRSSGLAAG